jgi:hypothetical protein
MDVGVQRVADTRLVARLPMAHGFRPRLCRRPDRRRHAHPTKYGVCCVGRRHARIRSVHVVFSATGLHVHGHVTAFVNG